MTTWIDCKRGDRVKTNDKATSEHRGKEGVCITDNTETQFGHKHVHVQFDDGTGSIFRTYELDMVKKWDQPKRKIVDNPQA